jgi:hypothetical protein
VGDVERISVRRPVVAVVAVVALAGCRSSHARTPQTGEIALRTLPAQGLIDETRRGVVLRDLHGRRLVWLPRFAVSPPDTPLEDEFLSMDAQPVLHGPHRWYRLDVARHALIPVRGHRVPIAAGATVVVRRGPTFAVERGGRVLVRGPAPTAFLILSPRLVQAGRTLLDVVTNRRGKLPPGCDAAGFRGRTLVLACGVAPNTTADAPLIFEEIAPGRAPRRIAQPVAKLWVEAASLSPDGAWVAAEGGTGCAASYVYVAPTRGGAAHIVYGRSTGDPYPANFSALLGWSADGRLVVQFTPPYCDEPLGPQHPPRGIYLVDPRTLARTFVTRSAEAMWSAADR